LFVRNHGLRFPRYPKSDDRSKHASDRVSDRVSDLTYYQLQKEVCVSLTVEASNLRHGLRRRCMLAHNIPGFANNSDCETDLLFE
jgi:hypothetical protein